MNVFDFLKFLGLSLLIIFLLLLIVWPFVSSMIEQTEKKLSVYSFVLFIFLLLSLCLCLFIYSKYSNAQKRAVSLQSNIDSLESELDQIESSAYEAGYSDGKQEGYDHYAFEDFDYSDGWDDCWDSGYSIGYEEASSEYENHISEQEDYISELEDKCY